MDRHPFGPGSARMSRDKRGTSDEVSVESTPYIHCYSGFLKIRARPKLSLEAIAGYTDWCLGRFILQ